MSLSVLNDEADLKAGSPAHVHLPAEAIWIEGIPGEKMALHVRSDAVGGAAAIIETIAEPGLGTPMHLHAEHEIFYVLEGRMTFSVSGRIFDAPTGATVVIPAGTHHTWKNRTAAPVRMLAIFTPGGIETMFERLAGLAPDAVIELVAQYGTIVVGPPLD